VRRPPDVATLRAAWWTWRSLRATRARLKTTPYTAVTVTAPPRRLPAGAERGVRAVLRRTDPTCLERSLVLQRWLACRGEAHDVVIGVTAPGPGFAAHAWLDGEAHGRGYRELTRLGP
jgi:hypothetical protein